MFFRQDSQSVEQSCVSNIDSIKRLHAEVLGKANEFQHTMRNTIGDSQNFWERTYNDTTYTLFASSTLAVGHSGVNLEYEKVGMKIVTDKAVILISVASDSLYYIEQVRNEDAQERATWTSNEVILDKSDWREAHHEDRGVLLNAMQYFIDEITAITESDHAITPAYIGHTIIDAVEPRKVMTSV